MRRGCTADCRASLVRASATFLGTDVFRMTIAGRFVVSVDLIGKPRFVMILSYHRCSDVVNVFLEIF